MLLRFTLLSLLSLILTGLNAQRAALQLTKMNVVYIGLPNPFEVAGEGLNDANIVTKTKGCSLKMDGLKGEIHVEEGRECFVYLGKINNYDTSWLDTFVFRVKRVPPPKANLGSLSGGTASSGLLFAQRKVYLYTPSFVYERIHYQVDSFYQIILFNDTIMWKKIIYQDTIIYGPSRQELIADSISGIVCKLVDYPIVIKGTQVHYPRKDLKESRFGALVMLNNMYYSGLYQNSTKINNEILIWLENSDKSKIPHFYQLTDTISDTWSSDNLIPIENFNPNKKGTYRFFNANGAFLFEQEF